MKRPVKRTAQAVVSGVWSPDKALEVAIRTLTLIRDDTNTHCGCRFADNAHNRAMVTLVNLRLNGYGEDAEVGDPTA